MANVHRLYFAKPDGITKVGISNYEPPLSLCDVEPNIKIILHIVVERAIETFGTFIIKFVIHSISTKCPYWAHVQHFQSGKMRCRFVRLSRDGVPSEKDDDVLPPVLEPGDYIIEYEYPLMFPSPFFPNSTVVIPKEDYPTFTIYFNDRIYDKGGFEIKTDSYLELVQIRG